MEYSELLISGMLKEILHKLKYNKGRILWMLLLLMVFSM